MRQMEAHRRRSFREDYKRQAVDLVLRQILAACNSASLLAGLPLSAASSRSARRTGGEVTWPHMKIVLRHALFSI